MESKRTGTSHRHGERPRRRLRAIGADRLAADHRQRQRRRARRTTRRGSAREPVRRIISITGGETALQRVTHAIGASVCQRRPRCGVGILHLVDENVRDKSGIRRRRQLRHIRLIELHAVGTIIELPAIRTKDRSRDGDAELRSKRVQLRNVGRVEIHQQEITARRQRGIRREVKVDRIAQAPGVRRIIHIEQRHGARGHVSQLNELVDHVVVRPDLRRVIQDLVNHHRTNSRPRVRRAGAGAELRNVRRIVHAERPLGQRREVRPRAGLETTERHAVLRRAELHRRPVARQRAACCRRGEMNLVALRRAERKALAATRLRIELILVEDRETARREHGAVRNAELPQIIPAVTQEPAADVDLLGREILQLDRVLQRQIRMGQRLAQRHAKQGAVVGFARRRGIRETHDVRRAVRESSLRHFLLLRAEAHDVHSRRRARRKERDDIAALVEFEADVVRSLGRRAVGNEPREAIRGRADERERRNRGLDAIRRIVREEIAADGNGLRGGIEQLEPIVFSRGRVRQPFVHPHRRHAGQRCDDVLRTARGNAQLPGTGAIWQPAN